MRTLAVAVLVVAYAALSASAQKRRPDGEPAMRVVAPSGPAQVTVTADAPKRWPEPPPPPAPPPVSIADPPPCENPWLCGAPAWPFVLPALGVAAPQAPPPPLAEPAPPANGTIQLDLWPSDALVFVDGSPVDVASVESGSLAVAPGQHTIEVQRHGYRPQHVTATVAAGRVFPLNVTLLRIDEAAGAGVVPAAAAAAPARAPKPAERGSGTLEVRVRKRVTAVYIDGRKQRESAPGQVLEVVLAAGDHVVRAESARGRVYVTNVRIRNGQTTTVEVPREGD